MRDGLPKYLYSWVLFGYIAFIGLGNGVLTTAVAQSTWYEVHFSQVNNNVAEAKANPQSLDRILVQKLAQAQTSIDAALHELDSERIAGALIQAHQRGVRVRLVTEHDYIEEDSIVALQAAGIPIISDVGHPGLMHNKFIVVDARFVWTGSFNTTDNGAFKNNNNAIWVVSTALAENFTHAFLDMFELQQFGGKSRSPIPHPVVEMPDGTTIRTAFSPDYDVGRFIVRQVRQAEKSIYFMAFSFTHDAVGNAIKERFAAGVEVRGVFESRGASTSSSELAAMQALGIPVITDANKWAMHHKVIIIDGHTVVTGSFNFSKNAARTNDENVLIISGNPDIARQFTEEYQRVVSRGTAEVKNAPVAGASSASNTAPEPTTAGVSALNSPALNINAATQTQLEGLPGIGPALAQRIIAGRPYRSLQDLRRVRGLGPSKVAALQGLVGFE